MTFELKGHEKNVINLARKAGYYFQYENEQKKEAVFSRPMGRSGYPRFHLYVNKTNNGFLFNLHLDQKRPIYKGTVAHSGEYDSPVVQKEVERIKEALL